MHTIRSQLKDWEIRVDIFEPYSFRSFHFRNTKRKKGVECSFLNAFFSSVLLFILFYY